MNLLIDTHILLWWLGFPGKLSGKIKSAIEDTKNTVFISSAALWEIAIKKNLGKLKIPGNLKDILSENDIIPLSITADHIYALENLPDIHNDPFDRIQIAQCIHERLVFVTEDGLIRKYGIEIF